MRSEKIKSGQIGKKTDWAHADFNEICYNFDEVVKDCDSLSKLADLITFKIFRKLGFANPATKTSLLSSRVEAKVWSRAKRNERAIMESASAITRRIQQLMDSAFQEASKENLLDTLVFWDCSVDPTLHSPIVTKRIAMAAIQNDRKFFKELSDSLKKGFKDFSRLEVFLLKGWGCSLIYDAEPLCHFTDEAIRQFAASYFGNNSFNFDVVRKTRQRLGLNRQSYKTLVHNVSKSEGCFKFL